MTPIRKQTTGPITDAEGRPLEPEGNYLLYHVMQGAWRREGKGLTLFATEATRYLGSELDSAASRWMKDFEAVAAENGDAAGITEAAYPGELKLTDECTGHSHGQSDCVVKARDKETGKLVGYLTYAVFDEQIHIQHVEAGPKRKGIATAMYEFLKRENPGIKINYGMMTPDGSAWKKSLREANRSDSEQQSGGKSVDARSDRKKRFLDRPKWIPKGFGGKLSHGLKKIAGKITDPLKKVAELFKSRSARNHLINHVKHALRRETRETHAMMLTLGKLTNGEEVTPQESQAAINQAIDLVKTAILGTVMFGPAASIAASGHAAAALGELALPGPDDVLLFLDRPIRALTKKLFGEQFEHGVFPHAQSHYGKQRRQQHGQAKQDWRLKQTAGAAMGEGVGDDENEDDEDEDTEEKGAKQGKDDDEEDSDGSEEAEELLTAIIDQLAKKPPKEWVEPHDDDEDQKLESAFEPSPGFDKDHDVEHYALPNIQHWQREPKGATRANAVAFHYETPHGKYSLYPANKPKGHDLMFNEKTLGRFKTLRDGAEAARKHHDDKTKAVESKDTLMEHGFARIMRHAMTEPHGFALLSADRSDRSGDNNAKHRADLEKHLRSIGKGFVHTKGGYVEHIPGGKKKEVEEHSYFVPKVTRQEAQALAKHVGNKHQQEAILWGHPKEGAHFINGNGESQHVGGKVTTMDIGDYFTKFHQRKFAFKEPNNGLQKIAASISMESLVIVGDTVEDSLDEKDFEYSSTQVDAPSNVAARIERMQKKINKVDLHPKEEVGRPHITVKFGLHTGDSDTVQQVINDAGVGPFEITLGKTSIFPGAEHDVVKVDVKSPELYKLNKYINDNIKCTTTYPYAPHLTLAYVKPGKGKKYVGMTDMDGIKFRVEAIMLSSKTEEKHCLYLPGAGPRVSKEGVDEWMDDEPDFTLDDVQLYFDMKVAGGESIHNAKKMTKDKFKIETLHVSPTGTVSTPSLALDPGDPPPTPPPMPMEPGGEEPEGGDDMGDEQPVGAEVSPEDAELAGGDDDDEEKQDRPPRRQATQNQLN